MRPVNAAGGPAHRANGRAESAMRILKLIMPALLALPVAASAQLDVSLTLPNKVLLRAEDVPAVITIRNNTGMTIPTGGAAGYGLDFEIKDTEGLSALPHESHRPVAPVLPPGASVTFTNNLFQCYQLMDISQAGVVARVDYGGTRYLSTREFINIQDGVEVARLEVPQGGRTLVHLLRTLNRGGHEHLFLRVDDQAGGWTFGAVDLGFVLRTASPPQLMLDGQHRTHILHRSGPTQFSYHVADPDGTLQKLENFTGDYKVIRMIASADGAITVSGRPADKSERPQVLQATPFRPDLHR